MEAYFSQPLFKMGVRFKMDRLKLAQIYSGKRMEIPPHRKCKTSCSHVATFI